MLYGDENECTAVMCDRPPTMTLDLTITVGQEREAMEQEIPYCDDHIGWFYRSFMRKSYDTDVRGITILLDVDDQFKSFDRS